MVGLGVGPPCLRVDSEESLLTLTDERAPLARTAHGVESLKYATQTTASVWMPFKQTYNGVSGDADFDYFEMAPCDAGGIHGDRPQDVMCRPVIAHKLDRRTTRNTENELDTIILIDTDSPRLTVTPGECHVSYGGTQIRCDLRRTHDTSAMTDGYTMKPNDMILRHLAECDESYISAEIDSAAVELYDVIFRRLRLLRKNVSTRHDKCDGFLNVDCVAAELYDVTFRRLRLPRRDISTERDGSFVLPEIVNRNL